MSDPALTVVALLVTGYLLMAAEIFLIPGFGVAGIGGLLCLGAGCYFAYETYGAAYGVLTVGMVLASATAALLWIPKTRFGRDVVHSSTLADAHAADTALAAGTVGVAESDLRPAGFARFGDRRQSVVTEGEYITAASRIVITEVHGSRIVVELAPPEQRIEDGEPT
jgi:membrane-bound serine protease (ClpP class)